MGDWANDILASRSESAAALERIDRALVATAVEKQWIGEKPSRPEAAALRRWHKAREGAARWEHYRTIPQKHWVKMSGGRPWKILREQAQRCGTPFVEAEIDLSAVVRPLHDFLAANWYKLAGSNGENHLLAGVNLPALAPRTRQDSQLITDTGTVAPTPPAGPYQVRRELSSIEAWCA